jgi:ABC-2 type transport system ATP-binding protein
MDALWTRCGRAPAKSEPGYPEYEEGLMTETASMPHAGRAEREVVVRTDGLTKQFGARTAVNGLSFEVRRGDVFGLLGPNGSGKTTTLRMLLGLIWPTSGSMSLFGESLTSDGARREALRRVGSIIEQPSFYPYLTGRENLRGVAIFAGQRDNRVLRSRVEEALLLVGLAPRANEAYRKYSLGMKQRLGVAAALISNPDLIVLDEPTNGLDPAGMVEVRALIGQLAARGTTVLLSSHLLHEIQNVCTQVAILREGSLLLQGDVSELLAVGQGIILGFARPEQYAEAISALREAEAGGATWLRGARYVLPEPGARIPPGGWLLLVDAPFERSAEVGAILAARGIYPAEMRQREASLEEFFLRITSAPPQSEVPPPPGAAPLPLGAPISPAPSGMPPEAPASPGGQP